MVSGPRARRVMLALVLVLVGPRGAPVPSFAQGAAADHDAEREYRLGYQALQAGDCLEALSHYRRSFDLVPRPRTLFNMAACEDQLGQAAEAWRNYHAFLSLAEPRDAEIVAKARVRIEALRARLAGRVSVASSPAGASVQVDGERASAGTTPVTLTLPPGEHLVRISMKDAVAVERSVEVAPDGTTALTVELALPSAIMIEVEPADAAIEPGDGGAPTRGRFEAAVGPGRYSFTIQRDGYQRAEIVVDAIAGRTYEEHVRLRPTLATATLVIAGAPGAAVTVDGVPTPTSSTPSGALAMRDLAAGAHEIRVTRAGRAPWRDALQLSPDEVVTVDLDLPPQRTTTGRSVAWGLGVSGLAGLIGGGVVGVLALRDVASPAPDDHDRGERRALVADGLFVVSAAALATAWWLVRGSSPSASIHRTHGAH
jgi:hypothetical protein